MSAQSNAGNLRPLTEDEIKLRPVTYVSLIAFFVSAVVAIFYLFALAAESNMRGTYALRMVIATIVALLIAYLTHRLSETDRKRSLKARQSGGSP